jgi:hypothetical protein
MTGNIPNSDDFVFDTLCLLEVGNYRAKQKGVRGDQKAQLLAIKDEMMRLLYDAFKNSGDLSFARIPYLQRCPECKGKADEYFLKDPTKTWEFHLSMMPPCPNDVEVLEKALIELLITYKNRNFSFHIPATKLVTWSFSTDVLPERKWIPEADFDRSNRFDSDERSFGEIIFELKKRMNSFKQELDRIQNKQASN